MESRCSCDLKFQSNLCFNCDLPAHTVRSLVPMGVNNYPKTPSTVEKLAVAGWFHYGCYGIIRHKVHIPSVLRLVNTGIQILVDKICIFVMEHVGQFEISSMCHLVDDTLESPSHSGHCNHQDWLIGWYRCWMPMWWWCCLYLQQVAGHRIESLQWILLQCFTDNAGKVVVRQITHSSMVFSYKMDSANPITTFSVTKLQSIAAATDVKVFRRLISSAISSPGISASQTHHLMMNYVAQTWCTRNSVPGWPGFESL